MTVDESMTDLVGTEYWHLKLKLPITKQRAYAIKRHFMDGQMKHETKMKYLLEAGYRISTPLSMQK